MVQATVPNDLDITMDGDDPTEPGDIKIVKGTLTELDDCDATTQWSVHSGAGVSLALDNVLVQEGSGSIKVTIPAGITAIIKATKSSGSWDISSHKYLKVYLGYRNTWNNVNLHFGEAAYNEQNKGVFNLSIGSDGGMEWVQASWDISAIAAASRNGVTIFAVTIPNASASTRYFWIDYVFADPGPSQIKGNDGDRTILIYPKVYSGSYQGTGSALTISIPRKGTVTGVIIQGAGHPSFWKTTSMAGTNSLDLGAGAGFQTDRITALGDCSFTLGTHADVNNSGDTYHYIAFFDD